MSSKKLSCGRDFFAVPNLPVALENGGKCGYSSVIQIMLIICLFNLLFMII